MKLHQAYQQRHDIMPRQIKCLIWAAATVVLLWAASVAGRDHDTATADGATVLPDAGGAISSLILHYDAQLTYELTPVYRDLFGKLSDRVTLQVLCSSDEDMERFCTWWGRRSLGTGRIVQVFSIGRPLSIWARDRRIARAYAGSGEQADAYIPPIQPDDDDYRVNDLVAPGILKQAGFGAAPMDSQLYLEGGNVVANGKHVFVGSNVIEDNLYGGLELQETHHELRRVLGRPYIMIRDCTGGVPWCHLDMYMTPIADDTILIASPVLADRLMLQSGGRSEWPWLVASAADPRELQDLYDSVAREVADFGYHVMRLPVVVDRLNDWMVTYNNVIFDTIDGIPTVYMPIYNIPALDRAAERIYRRLGYDVQTIDVSRVFTLGGTVRCLTNVTARQFDGRLEHCQQPMLSRFKLANIAPLINEAAEYCPQ